MPACLASTVYALTPEQHASFNKDGFIRLPAFFTETDLAAARAAV